MLARTEDPLAPLRVAIVHDWLYTIGGAERVLAAILKCFPGADVHCLFDALTPEQRSEIGHVSSQTSFLSRMPGINRRHRLYLPLMPLAIEQIDLSAYDLVISSSFAVAKGVITGPNQVHVSYVHSPMRYAWDMQHQYLAESGLTRGIKGALARLLLHRMRIWDVRTNAGVDAYVANSRFVARRIRKLYGRQATVINPPVSVPIELPERPLAADGEQPYFLTASRLVPYKNIRAIAQAFGELPEHRLIIVGDGPEQRRIAAVAGRNVELRGRVPDAELRRLMAGARAFIFAAEEDFGIVPVEAQAMGTPVIALGRGGALETVIGHGPHRTGLFFQDAEPETIAAAVRRFDADDTIQPEDCHTNAMRFSEARFRRDFREFVRSVVIQANEPETNLGAFSADDAREAEFARAS